MPKLLISILVLLISLSGFAQGEVRKEPLTPGGGQVIIRSSIDHGQTEIPAADSAAPETAPVAVDDESIVDEAKQDQLNQIEKFKKVESATAPILNPKNLGSELEELGHKQLTAASLMDDKVIAMLQKNLSSGANAKLFESDVRANILAKVKGSFTEKFFVQFPKLLDVAVDIVRDKDALSGLIGIMVRKSDLKDYAYISIAIFVFSLFIKNRVVQPKWNFGKRFIWSMWLNLFFTSISFYLFYTFFSVELGPTLRIFSKHLL